MDNQAVKDYFLFDEADLAANRSGRLSENQQKNLTEVDKGGTKILVGLTVGLFVIAAIYPILSVVISKSSPGLGSIIWAIIWGGAGSYCLYILLFNNSDTSSKIIVKKVQGPVHFAGKGSSSSGSGLEYVLHIGKEKLDVVEDSLRSSMQEGDIYSAYFYNIKDRTGNHILSLEGPIKE